MTQTGIIKRLALVTLTLLLATNWVAFREIEQVLGHRLMDLRPLGYDAEDVREFLAPMTVETKGVYQRVYLVLDTGLIGFLFASAYAVGRWLRPRRFWWALPSLVAAYVLADCCENWLVSRLILDNPIILPDWLSVRLGLKGLSIERVVTLADLATRIKFAALLLAGAMAVFSFGDRTLK